MIFTINIYSMHNHPQATLSLPTPLKTSNLGLFAGLNCVVVYKVYTVALET